MKDVFNSVLYAAWWVNACGDGLVADLTPFDNYFLRWGLEEW